LTNSKYNSDSLGNTTAELKSIWASLSTLGEELFSMVVELILHLLENTDNNEILSELPINLEDIQKQLDNLISEINKIKNIMSESNDH